MMAPARTVPSRAMVRRYLKQQTRSTGVPPGIRRQAGSGSGGDREAAVVPGEVAGQEGVGPVAVVDARETQLRHEPVLERAPEPFDPALGLGAAGGDRADAQLGEGPAQLRRHARVDELLLERERLLRAGSKILARSW